MDELKLTNAIRGAHNVVEALRAMTRRSFPNEEERARIRRVALMLRLEAERVVQATESDQPD